MTLWRYNGTIPTGTDWEENDDGVISFQNAMRIHGALVGHLGPKVKNFEGFKFDAGSDHV